MLALLRRMAGLPLLQHLTRVGPLLRLSYAMRAQLVSERTRFALNELKPGARIGTYHLRGSPVAICVRHHTADVMVLDEIFSQRVYELPEEVEVALKEIEALKVLDLGANVGLFAAFIVDRYPSALLTAFEPEPTNAAVLGRFIAANGREWEWRLIEACAATSDGTVRFSSGKFSVSAVAAGDGDNDAIELPALDVFPHLEEADLVKIDIEGSEWALLGDMRFKAIPARAIVMEYHPSFCPEPDPREAAIRHLEAAGYRVLCPPAQPDGTGTIWGFRDPGHPKAGHERHG